MTRDELVRACFAGQDLPPGDLAFTVTVGDGVVANVDLYWRTISVTHTDGEKTWIPVAAIAQVCTHPDFRRRGLASALLQAAHFAAMPQASFAALFGRARIYTTLGYQPTNVPTLLVRPLSVVVPWPDGVIDYGARKW